MVSAAMAATVLVATAGRGVPLCPLRVATGHACPGCGLTRAVAAGIRGDWAQSLAYHPLALAVAAQVLLFAVLHAAGQSQRLASRLPALLIANLVVFTATWLSRWHLGLLELVH